MRILGIDLDSEGNDRSFIDDMEIEGKEKGKGQEKGEWEWEWKGREDGRRGIDRINVASKNKEKKKIIEKNEPSRRNETHYVRTAKMNTMAVAIQGPSQNISPLGQSLAVSVIGQGLLAPKHSDLPHTSRELSPILLPLSTEVKGNYQTVKERVRGNSIVPHGIKLSLITPFSSSSNPPSPSASIPIPIPIPIPSFSVACSPAKFLSPVKNLAVEGPRTLKPAKPSKLASQPNIRETSTSVSLRGVEKSSDVIESNRSTLERREGRRDEMDVRSGFPGDFVIAIKKNENNERGREGGREEGNGKEKGKETGRGKGKGRGRGGEKEKENENEEEEKSKITNSTMRDARQRSKTALRTGNGNGTGTGIGTGMGMIIGESGMSDDESALRLAYDVLAASTHSTVEVRHGQQTTLGKKYITHCATCKQQGLDSLSLSLSPYLFLSLYFSLSISLFLSLFLGHTHWLTHAHAHTHLLSSSLHLHLNGNFIL